MIVDRPVVLHVKNFSYLPKHCFYTEDKEQKTSLFLSEHPETSLSYLIDRHAAKIQEVRTSKASNQVSCSQRRRDWTLTRILSLLSELSWKIP